MATATKSAPTTAQAQAAVVSPSQARHSSNLQYLLSTVKKNAVCPPAAGAGTTQTLVAGQTLIYDVPTINGAFADEFLFKVAATINPATGTGATYALNPGAPFTIFDRIIVTYGKTQITIRPYLLRTLALLAGYERSAPEQVNTGNAIASLSSTIWGSPFALTTATNNPWNFYFRLPLRWLKKSAAGMLPIMGTATACQVSVVIASNMDGLDPILSPVAGSNTGHAVVLGGTLGVEVIYRDGTNYMSPTPMTLDLTGLPTFQVIMDRQLNPLTAATVMRQRFGEKLQHLYALSTIVDGNQSNLFAANSNIQALELDQDFNGDNAFWRYGATGSNVGVTEFFERYRDTLGQDMDQGIIPWVPGPAFNGINPDNQEGMLVLNMMPGGWVDTSYGVQVGTVTTSNFTPRVETALISLNPAGLVTQ